MKRYISRVPVEAFIWIGALIFLAVPGKHHNMDLCPSRLLFGVKCMGCGIGHSMSMVLHGNIAESFRYHVLGVFAVIMIIYRIVYLIVKGVKNHG